MHELRIIEQRKIVTKNAFPLPSWLQTLLHHPLKLDPANKVAIVHECAHAIVDLFPHKSTVTDLTEEAACYLAQFLFELSERPNWVRKIIKNTTDNIGREIALEAVRIIDKHNMMNKKAYLSSSDHYLLRATIQKHPSYRDYTLHK